MNVRKIKFPYFSDSSGMLGVYESVTHVPFKIKRLFTIKANSGNVRGKHAHIKCSQLLVCLSGRVDVMYTDGVKVKNVILDRISTGLLIPPSIWSEQKYLDENTVLIVMCDQFYDKNDYIRAFEDYVIYKKTKK